MHSKRQGTRDENDRTRGGKGNTHMPSSPRACRIFILTFDKTINRRLPNQSNKALGSQLISTAQFVLVRNIIKLNWAKESRLDINFVFVNSGSSAAKSGWTSAEFSFAAVYVFFKRMKKSEGQGKMRLRIGLRYELPTQKQEERDKIKLVPVLP